MNSTKSSSSKSPKVTAHTTAVKLLALTTLPATGLTPVKVGEATKLTPVKQNSTESSSSSTPSFALGETVVKMNATGTLSSKAPLMKTSTAMLHKCTFEVNHYHFNSVSGGNYYFQLYTFTHEYYQDQLKSLTYEVYQSRLSASGEIYYTWNCYKKVFNINI